MKLEFSLLARRREENWLWNMTKSLQSRERYPGEIVAATLIQNEKNEKKNETAPSPNRKREGNYLT